jgi:hypothetical protein
MHIKSTGIGIDDSLWQLQATSVDSPLFDPYQDGVGRHLPACMHVSAQIMKLLLCQSAALVVIGHQGKDAVAKERYVQAHSFQSCEASAWPME